MYYSQPYGYDFYGGYRGFINARSAPISAIVLVLFILLVIIGYRK